MGKSLVPKTCLVVSTPGAERASRADKVEQEIQGRPGPLGSTGPKVEPCLGVLQTQLLRIPPSGSFRGHSGARRFNAFATSKQSSMQIHGPHLGQLVTAA